MISLIFLFLAGAARGLAELTGYEHADSIFSGKVPADSFWGGQMWKRKYRRNKYGALYPYPLPGMRRLQKMYYKTFRIKYQERFLLSATALVWLTDGMHLANYLMKFCLIGACMTAWWSYDRWTDVPLIILGYILAWTGGFNLTYSVIFQRRLE